MPIAEPWVQRHGDLLWGAIAGAIVTYLVSYLFYRKGDRPARLDYFVGNGIRLAQSAFPDISVLYKGNPVVEPWSVVVRIGNYGKTNFQSSDFRSPVQIDFHSAKWLGVSVAARSGDNARLDSEVSNTDRSKYLLMFDLLNSGDWVELRFVLDGEPNIAVSTHAVGVKSMRRLTRAQPLSLRGLVRDLLYDGMLKVTITGLVVAFVVFYALTNPNSVANIAHAIGKFFDDLVS